MINNKGILDMALQIENITKTYGTDVIIKNISLTASEGEKIGLIGPNGAGKSTLLKIISGEISCDEGRILTPRDCRIGFLRQDTSIEEDKTIHEYMMAAFDAVTSLGEELRQLEDRMANGLEDYEHDKVMKIYGEKSDLFEKRGGFQIQTSINTILTGMGFDSFDKNMKIKNLSGGEKTKLAMARLLVESPEVLLLDEPTNHLDFKTMQWLEGYLRSYKGIVIAVSHDRYFLDALSHTIYEIDRNTITRYTGNYSSYLIQKKQNDEIALKHYNARVEEVKRLEDYVAKNIVRASTSKMAKSKQKAIERIEIGEKPVTSTQVCRFKFDGVFRSYNDVLTIENVSLKIPKSGILETLAKNITLDIKRGEKAAVIGANGVGKSTLIKTILGRHDFFEGDIDIGNNTKISYYDQEQKQLTDTKTVFAEISDRFPLMDEVDIRTKLSLVLFKDEDVFKIVGDLSGGERARLMFLIIMLEKPNFLILDEPTNHLDLPAKEALDTAIAEYEGTVLFVSHDRYFLNKTADKVFELSENGITAYKGNYDDYVSAVSSPSETKAETIRQNTGATDYESAKRHQAQIRSLQKKVASAEEEISSIEAQIEELDLKLSECGADFELAKELYAQKSSLEDKLTEVYELWNSYTEELNELN
jgi:ATP-binding cassette subfamily F protein 3